MTTASRKTATQKASRTTAAKTAGAKTTTARKASAKTTGAKTTAAKTAGVKATTAKTTGAKATTAKTTGAKTTTARKAGARTTAARKAGAKTVGAKQAGGKATARTTAAKKVGAKKVTSKATAARSSQPVLLSGGNPQIAKGDGDAPVKAYIAAMPGWKREVGRRLDALVERTVPNVRKAVRWNTPFYGIEGQGWFLGYHCFTNYVKIVFLRGMSLRPRPPVGSKHPNTRYFHVHEHDAWDEDLVAAWIRQASERPGEPLF